MIDIESKAKTYSYEAYKTLIKDLFEEGKVTGSTQNEIKVSATKINLTRIKRWDKMFKVSDALHTKMKTITTPTIWYVISEGWCGDSAQTLPLIAKMADASPNIELKIVLRDENPEVMNAYLTNGGEAVPKLIARDKNTGKDLYLWGPRPTKIHDMVQDYKTEFTLNNYDDFVKNLHLWYARDKGQAIQEDFLTLI